jgi:hypothetical protein
VIALLAAVMFIAEVTCGTFGSLDFVLPDPTMNDILERRMLNEMGDNSITRCVIEKSKDVMIRGGRRFCSMQKKRKTPPYLTLDGYFWSAGETLKIQCLNERSQE